MWRAHARTVFIIGATKMVDIVLVFAAPLLLQQLLLSLQEGWPTGDSQSPRTFEIHVWHFFLPSLTKQAWTAHLSQVMDLQIHGLWHSGHTLTIACAMFLTSMANTIVNNRYMHRSMRLVMHLKVRTT